MRNYLFPIPIVIFLITFFNPAGIYAAYSKNEAADLYNRAGELYQNAQFEASLDIYEELIKSGIKNPDLYFNASNAAYRSGFLGKAILYVEQSLNLAPSDPDALSNLAFLNSIKKDQEPLQDNVVVAFLTRHYDAINVNSGAILSAVSFAVAMLFATGALFFQQWKKTASIAILICCGLIFIFSTGLFLHKINRNNTVREAIIMLDEVKAYSGPGQDNTHIFTIHEGTKVVIERHQDSWNLIRLKSGAGGWIHSETMEEI